MDRVGLMEPSQTRIAGAALAAGALGLLWLLGAPGSLLVVAGLMFVVAWCLASLNKRSPRQRAASGDGGGGAADYGGGDGGSSSCGGGDGGGGGGD